ncbi:MAG: glutathione S-transferase family protein [Micropepsaceae bacterium]
MGALTVWGEGRGFRVVWLLEEMSLAYRLRDVDLLKGAENDTEFMAVNPGGFIPALQDGETIIVESIAIMEYLIARHGGAALAPAPDDERFAPYQQFLHLGEAGLMGTMFFAAIPPKIAPDGAGDNWTSRWAGEMFESRRRLVARQLARAPYMAGEAFTAADISVTYALDFARRVGGVAMSADEAAYVARTSGRDGYRRAMRACPATRGWAESLGEGPF